VPRQGFKLCLGPRTQQPLAVYQHNAQRLPAGSDGFREPQQQRTVTCAKLDNRLGRPVSESVGQCSQHNVGVTHPCIDLLLIAARPDGTTIASRQFVEQLAFHFAFHLVDLAPPAATLDSLHYKFRTSHGLIWELEEPSQNRASEIPNTPSYYNGAC
jgi:hypothetical protein